MGSPGTTGRAQLTLLVTGGGKGGQGRCCTGLEHSRVSAAKHSSASVKRPGARQSLGLALPQGAVPCPCLPGRGTRECQCPARSCCALSHPSALNVLALSQPWLWNPLSCGRRGAEPWGAMGCSGELK